MKLKYKCLVMDHDDTVVMSTPEIHYPSFVQAMQELRPGDKTISLEEFYTNCFHPGFSCLMNDVLKMTEYEQEYQYKVWLENAKRRIPDFYPDIEALLVDFKAEGGLVAVVSHSEIEQIERDYKNKTKIMPDIIFGWEKEETKRKPNPYPLQEILKRFGLKESEALVVDDLKPGLLMARSCKVDFAAVGWSHSIEAIESYMRENADYYLKSAEELRRIVFAG